MQYAILMHEADDDVGVAVMDLAAGSEVGAATLEGQSVGSLVVIQDIPLGHKVAMRDLPLDKRVIEYGRPIGRATQAIKRGEHVHVHNIRTLRW
jgi:(2R)-sulfolactate sulfo-lyase subunit alpha